MGKIWQTNEVLSRNTRHQCKNTAAYEDNSGFEEDELLVLQR